MCTSLTSKIRHTKCNTFFRIMFCPDLTLVSSASCDDERQSDQNLGFQQCLLVFQLTSPVLTLP